MSQTRGQGTQPLLWSLAAFAVFPNPVTAASPEMSSFTFSTLPIHLCTIAFSKMPIFPHCLYIQMTEEKEQRPQGGMPGETSHLMVPRSNQRQQAQTPCKGHDTWCSTERHPSNAGLATCRAQQEWLLWGLRGDLLQMRAARQQCPETTPAGGQLHPKWAQSAF